jgi:lysophospholipase L1-like esterase
MQRALRALFLFVAVWPAALASADEFFVRDGDRVVMIGDSITEQHLYSNYVEMWVSTRFPAWDITFRNVGIGGDRSVGGNSRFQRDVVAHKPTAMTVDFGMNDGGYRAFDEPGFKTYMGGLQGMADQAKAAGIRVAWATPQPLDNGDQGPTALVAYNQTLEKYSDGVKLIAEKNGGLFVDQFHPYLAVLDKARAAGPKYDRITGGDAVHPGPPGQALMAFSILQGLHFPKLVSSVEIDLTNLAGVKATQCSATELARDGDGLRFVRQDRALPFFPDDAKPILKWTPLLEMANQYGLKVTGLKPGKYDVRLGDKKVAEYTAEQLAGGVNLAEPALAAGPIAEQVRAIRGAIEAKNRFYHDKIFRGVVLVNLGALPDWLGINLSPAEVESKRQSALAERMSKMPDLDAAIRQAQQIKPHTVAIVPSP